MTENEKAVIARLVDPSWVDFTISHTDSLFVIDDNHYYRIEKPKIQTDFCFGYGNYLWSTEEQEMIASEQAHRARTDSEYFIRENLRVFEKLTNAVNNAEWFSLGSDGECNIISSHHALFEVTAAQGRLYRRVTDEDKTSILALIADARERFAKRLQTYLKRYGLSKLKVWTYLVD